MSTPQSRVNQLRVSRELQGMASSLDGCLTRLVKKCDNANRRSDNVNRDTLYQKLDELRAFNQHIRRVRNESNQLRAIARGSAEGVHPKLRDQADARPSLPPSNDITTTEFQRLKAFNIATYRSREIDNDVDFFLSKIDERFK